MKARFILAVLWAAPVLALAQAQADPVAVASPDGQIELRLFLTKPEDSRYFRLAYQVSFRGNLLIAPSLMGLALQDQDPFLGENLGLSTTSREAVDETYAVPGKAKPVRSHYNSLVAIYIQNGSLGRRISLEARAYNDGVAFRYYLSKTPQTEDLRIEEEATEFRFAQDGQAFSRIVQNYETRDEDEYRPAKLSALKRDSLISLPFLVEQPGVGWVAITEAQIENYAGLFLFHAGGRIVRSTLAPRADDKALAVHGTTPAELPWRVLMISAEARKLRDSDIVQNLNPASAISDTSWIKQPKELISISDTAELEEQFARLEKAGATGVKVDLKNRADQQMMEFYRRAAKTAAAHHLMIEFQNGPTPDGIERTWPNVLVREDTPFRRLLGSR